MISNCCSFIKWINVKSRLKKATKWNSRSLIWSIKNESFLLVGNEPMTPINKVKAVIQTEQHYFVTKNYFAESKFQITQRSCEVSFFFCQC